ncbi:SGNH/GDSL hydrolase family protein [Paenibacillus ginsengarvi]|uniref:SGNH/GDSL hydrolase family protein n=1 Tax=Paenibacillus ginsengarvi TaxID=400777 RepID=A0A3B0BSW3_9BACL|nr:SGNH/GDSL hydrolase family protein [Paenibacillus ginsengarvi]RKN76012.1 SGNH/GDSL hydrolase family protein [Paenibacillus ginsengarvi]
MSQTSWFKNCLRVIQKEDGGLWPIRFTEAQFDAYRSSEARHIRSLCASGAMIDIVTDSATLTFDYSIGGAARNWLYFDLYIDGMFVQSSGQAPITDKQGTFHVDLTNFCGTSADKRHVSLYLPHLVEMTLFNIQLSAGASAEPAAPRAKNLLALGDSITQGMDAKRPAAAYPLLVAQALDMHVLNHGVGGYVFNASSIDPTMSYQPDLITVAYGTNDWNSYQTIDALREACIAYMDKLTQTYPGVPVLFLTPIWRKDWNEPKPMGTFAQLCTILGDIAASYAQVRVLDGLKLVPHQLLFMGDGVHPNDEGFQYMASGIVRAIEEGNM